ncbi:MAG: hypothetical protein P4L84_34980 [Isosphaeraceae bacterium]|nr:hypothetical protein [Isosphaeraceae bacterium]
MDSKLKMDWTGVVFVPGTGSTCPIDEVKDVTPHDGGSPERWYADAAKYPKGLRVVNKTTTVKIRSGNIAALRAVPADTFGTLSFTHNDYLNGSGSGAIVYTLADCQRIEIDDGGENNKFGEGTVTFEAISPDGVTSPLTSVVTP